MLRARPANSAEGCRMKRERGRFGAQVRARGHQKLPVAARAC